MIVEIPKFSRPKFEIATGEELNAIKQDVKKGPAARVLLLSACT
jgi:inorganic pyrophosphatase